MTFIRGIVRLFMGPPTPTTAERVMAALDAGGAMSGFDISQATGMAPGKTYHALFRLEQAGALVSWWDPEPSPRRRMYEKAARPADNGAGT